MIKKFYKSIVKGVLFSLIVGGIFLGMKETAFAYSTSQPNNVKQTAATASSVNCSWNTASSTGLPVYYYVQLSESESFPTDGMVRSNTTGNNVNVSLTQLNSGKTYYFRVGASTIPSAGTGASTTLITGTPVSDIPQDVYWSSPIEVVTIPDTLDKAGITESDPETTSMTINWSAMAGANCYKIGYWESADSSSNAKTVTTNSTSIQLTNLEQNTKYNIYVDACRKSREGYLAAPSSAHSEKDDLILKPTKVTGVTNTYFSMSTTKANASFTYDGITNASGYQYKIYNSKGQKILDRKVSSSSTGFRTTDSSLRSNQIYSIKVRAYVYYNGGNNENKLYGDSSTTRYFGKLPNNTQVSLANSGGKLKVNWKKVPGATKYKIYVSTKGSSGYKKYATVSGTSKTLNLKLKENKTYYVRVLTMKTVNKTNYYVSCDKNFDYSVDAYCGKHKKLS